MNFWLMVSILTVIVAIICFYPLLRQPKPEPSIERDKLNKAFYFHRLKELERDEQQGLLDNAEQLKTDLQHALLEDIPTQQTETVKSTNPYGKSLFTVGFLFIAVISMLAYLPIGSWHLQTTLAKNYDNLPYFYERLKSEDKSPLTESELSLFAQALRIKLQKAPHNPREWNLLGDLGVRMNNPQLTLDSYAKAYQQESSNAVYAVNYARILMMSADPVDRENAKKVLSGVLHKDHHNPDVLSLLAFYFFEKEDYVNAKIMWTQLLQQLPENDPRAMTLRRTLLRVDQAIEAQTNSESK